VNLCDFTIISNYIFSEEVKDDLIASSALIQSMLDDILFSLMNLCIDELFIEKKSIYGTVRYLFMMATIILI
jgi:hypothetical protein